MEAQSEPGPGSVQTGSESGPGRAEGSKRTQFKAGQKFDRKKVVGPKPAAGGVEVPQQLRDMRWVYGRKPGEKGRGDRSHSQRMMRQFFESSPAQFLSQMQKLEAEYRAECEKARRAEAGEAVAELPRGEQELRLVGVIEDLLSRYPGRGT